MPTYVDVLVEPHADCPEGLTLRYKAEDAPREVTRVVHPDSGAPCRVVGRTRAGEVAARAVTVEDSGSGTAVLVVGGELGLRLVPEAGGDPFAEPYLLIAPEDVLA